MANETVVKVGADSSGYTAELDKARKSATAFMNTQSEMAQRAAVAQDAIAEATANGSDASARAVKAFTDALLKNASTAGKSRAEILAMRAANLGLSDSVKPYIDQIAKASEHTHSFSLESSAAKRELLVLGHELSQGNYKQFAGSLLVMAEATGAFNMLLNPVVLGVGAFVGVLAIAAHSTFAAREQLAAYGETVEKISKQTGLSTDDVQKFGFAAKTVGIETKDAAEALADLTKAQNEAQHGNKDAAAAFAAVGVSLKTLKSASPEDLLARVADAFSKSADGASKAAVANELFGTAGKNLIPLLDQGSARLAQLGATATDVGAVLSAKTIAQLSALQEQLELSHAKMDALTLAAKTALLPTIINLTDALADNVAMKPLLNDFYAGVAIIMKTAASAVATLVAAFEETSEVVATLVTVVAYGMTGQFKMAAASAQAGYDNLKKQGQGYADFMSRLWSNTTPGGDSHGAAPTGQINFSKGDNAPKAYQESRADSLMDQAKQAQATLEASLNGQEKLTGWAAKEVELRAEIDGLAGRTLTKAQQSVLAHQTELLAQYSLNASLEKQIDLRTRIDKLNTEAYETNSKIQDQNDALSAQHKIQLDTMTLGTKERQRQIELLNIETERQKELADWQKKAINERLDGTPQDTEERASINSRFDARRDETTSFFDRSDLASQNWVAGAKGGLQDIIDKTNDFASAANNTAQNSIASLGDAVADFATTGKLNMGDFVKAAIGSLIKLETEALIAKAILASFNFFGAAGSEAVGASATSTPDDLISGYGHATGGYIAGPGTGTSDSIPARLSNGEFVMTAAAVRRIGASNLDAMNNGAAVHSVARFASGGLVGAASGVSPSARAGDINIDAPVTVQGGADAGANASGAADLQKKITAAVRAVVVNERRQGGALWKMQNGIA
ncbi:phage tail tape measure protein [Caballeronia sp. LZ032]|uniref:phage tail tape measure protein n=1 Tax=Caballeronia sp. LZ032 TaxID=3038565 RepID=UPI00285CE127|nr:phage tail tape measure protein [Caballeronia sp. LZ032]MDR5881124.1 phage tail tape measure protein [Caballeronia sp. LZ032]